MGKQYRRLLNKKIQMHHAMSVIGQDFQNQNHEEQIVEFLLVVQEQSGTRKCYLKYMLNLWPLLQAVHRPSYRALKRFVSAPWITGKGQHDELSDEQTCESLYMLSKKKTHIGSPKTAFSHMGNTETFWTLETVGYASIIGFVLFVLCCFVIPWCERVACLCRCVRQCVCCNRRHIIDYNNCSSV